MMMMAMKIHQIRTVARPAKGIAEGKAIPEPVAVEEDNRGRQLTKKARDKAIPEPLAVEGDSKARPLTKKARVEKVGIGLQMASGQLLGTRGTVIEKEVRTVHPENARLRTGSVYSPVQASRRSHLEQEIHPQAMMLQGSE